MEENESGFQSYTKLEKIGSGAYGVVYKALDKKTNQYVAMKKSLLDVNSHDHLILVLLSWHSANLTERSQSPARIVSPQYC
jgi:serine/threonine protein kinase